VKPIVFLGPSLPVQAAAGILNAEYRPPVEQGSVHRALQLRPPAIGIIDGRFDVVPAVCHKEIMYAMQSVPVYGAASMGALRAVELQEYGMIGIGQIYKWYRDGVVTDDDEVAVAHLDADRDFKPVSESLVDMRALLARARESGIIGADVEGRIIARARDMFYPDRTWPNVLADMEGVAAFRKWWPHRRRSQKSMDACDMLARMARDAEKSYEPSFEFEPTDHWEEAWEMDRGQVPDGR